MNSLTGMVLFLRREQRKQVAGMAAAAGFMVGIPLTFLIVYGVGFWNWSPLWAAPVLLAIPVIVMLLAARVIGRKSV